MRVCIVSEAACVRQRNAIMAAAGSDARTPMAVFFWGELGVLQSGRVSVQAGQTTLERPLAHIGRRKGRRERRGRVACVCIACVAA